ncbi:MAG: GxxExxY protein, partial [Anaerolineales bacterium]
MIELGMLGGISVKQQHPIPVFYKEIKVGEYFTDLFIDDTILVELKSITVIGKEHEAQLVHYL